VHVFINNIQLSSNYTYRQM